MLSRKITCLIVAATVCLGPAATFSVTAKADPRPSCEGILIPAFERSYTTAIFFKSEMRNRFLLFLKRNRLKEVSVPVVKTQCMGSCYFHGTQTNIETTLKSRGLLPQDAALSSFVNQMKIAWFRYQVRKTPNLVELLEGGHLEAYRALIEGPTFYLTEDQIRSLGGPQKLASMDEDLIKKYSSKSFFNWRGRKLRSILDLDFASFVEEVRKIQERALTLRAWKAIELKPLHIKDLELHWSTTGHRLLYRQVTEGTTKMSQFDGSIEGSKKYIQQTDGSQRSSFEKIAKLFILAIDRGETPAASLSHLFDERLGKPHMIALTGYVVNRKGTLEGFKFVNSWGREKHADGFGYISVSQLQTFLEGFSLIGNIEQ